jgi:hypothetical protein
MPRIDTPDDLVEAVDGLLIARFGADALWWHCGAVEQALGEQRPEMIQDISQLIEVYETARYGPETYEINPAQLERAAHALARLAESHPHAEEPAPQAAVALP